MYLSEIEIRNYKSIYNVVIPIEKYGDSWTSVFVGLNEVGKSNLLDAISLLSETINKKTYKFKDIAYRDSKEEFVDLYYRYKFNKEDEWKKELKKYVNCSPKFEKVFKITGYEKNVFLRKDKTSFSSISNILWEPFDISQFSFAMIQQGQNPNEKLCTIKDNDGITEEEKNSYTLLDKDSLLELLKEYVFSNLKTPNQELSIWKAEEKYLITKSIDLNAFAADNSISIPLTNLFALCDLDTKEKIQEKISSLTPAETRTLSRRLSKNATKYINEVWKEHGVSIDVEIENSTKILNVYITDKDNEDEFFGMDERSQGFKHFISLILHLSISNKKEKCKDQIIIIDEPENHLHPSGIRYMRDELIKIGKNNYVFVATHSPFMIDNKNMGRHFIVKKSYGKTQIKQIREDIILADEEVLRMGFGINVLKDLLTPYKVLVEGKSDFNLLRKSIKKVDVNSCIGITNGQGGNIVQVASLLKYSDVDCIVIVDDDDDGKKYKEKIIELGAPFSPSNVMTIRDLCGDIIVGGTIEDTLNLEFIKACLNPLIKKENAELNFEDENTSRPILEKIKIFLHKNGLNDKSDEIIYKLKSDLAEKFNTSSFETKHPLLKKLTEAIIQKTKGC